MANLPQSLSMNGGFGGPGPGPGPGPANAVNKDRKMQSAEQLVLDLSNPDLRENALLELSKNKELFQDLAPYVWNSFGTIAALIQPEFRCDSPYPQWYTWGLLPLVRGFRPVWPFAGRREVIDVPHLALELLPD